MKQVNVYEAKTRLSALLDEAAEGEEIVIAKNGKPKAKLVNLEFGKASSTPRKMQVGFWADWNVPEPLPELSEEEIDDWYDGPILHDPPSAT